MGKRFYRLLVVIFLLASFTFLSEAAWAGEPKPTVVVGSEEIFSGDQFWGGETIIFSGRVEGDLYLGGGVVTFDGVTEGDLIAVGGKVTVKGTVGQSLRVAGGQVSVDSEVGRNLLAVGSSVEVGETTVVAGSSVAAGGNIEESGVVNGGGHVFGSRVYLNGTWGGDLRAAVGEELLLGPMTQIAGNLTYQAPEKLTLSEGMVTGEVAYSPLSQKVRRWSASVGDWEDWPPSRLVWRRVGRWVALPFRAAWLIAGFLLGLLLINLFPKGSLQVVKTLEAAPLKSLLWGFLSWFIFPLSFILLVISLIGILLLPLWGLFLGLIVLAVKVLGPLAVGRYLLLKMANEDRRGWALLIGLLISFVLGFIPLIGCLYGLLLGTATLGAITAATFHSPTKKPRLRRG